MKSSLYPFRRAEDPLIVYAENLIREVYGDTVSVRAKSKTLNKFGFTANADTGIDTTVAQFPGAVVNETFVSTNLIDSVVSSSASDSQVVTIEGHTIDGSGNLTFVVQDATLNGQTPVSLSTPLARANRLFIKPSGTFNTTPAAFVGNISVYDNTDGATSGVPDTDAAVKLYVTAGLTQSRKAATSVSSVDYWIIRAVSVSLRRGTASARADFRVESRDVANGGVFRPAGSELTLTPEFSTDTFPQEPFLIIPPNHDVRLICTTTAANATASGDIKGVLAAIQ